MGAFKFGGIVEQVTTTTTSGSLVTLTNTSKQVQVFTGSTAQTIQLPDATTMSDGQKFEFHNTSSAALTIHYHDTTALTTVPAGYSLIIKLYDNGTSNGTWTNPTAATVTSVALSVPSFLSISGSPITSSGTLAISLSGTSLAVTSGGSGVTSTTAYGVLCGGTTSTGAFQNAGAGTSGYLLTSNGSSAIPTWNQQIRTINAQTGTTYTFALSDGSGAGGQPLVTFGSSSATTVTVPTNASVAFPVGTEIDCLQQGSGKVTFAAAGGVTINSASSNLSIASQYIGVSLLKTATDTWTLIGNLIA